MIYRLPDKNDQSLVQEYIQERCDYGETDLSDGLELSSDEFVNWVETVHHNALAGDEVWGKSLLYFCLDENRLIGLLSIRYELSDSLSLKYGDIGYSVRPTERNKGYATVMLRYALSVCKEKGMDRVILGCYKDNLPSAAVIKKCGGELIAENDNYTKGKISQYYRICL